MKCKLLIVDDEKKMVKYLSRRLSLRGFDVKTAFNGREALLLMRDHPFDVVLLDLQMPEMDGIEALKQMKTISPSSAVILLTGNASAAAEGKQWGALDIVLKPFDMNELIGKIHLATGQRFREEDMVENRGQGQTANFSD